MQGTVFQGKRTVCVKAEGRGRMARGRTGGFSMTGVGGKEGHG